MITIAENGQIKILNAVRLSKNAKVYVVVPDREEGTRFRVATPRLGGPRKWPTSRWKSPRNGRMPIY